jgi:hypothetical protein
MLDSDELAGGPEQHLQGHGAEEVSVSPLARRATHHAGRDAAGGYLRFSRVSLVAGRERFALDRSNSPRGKGAVEKMKRISIAGLCLMAALALTALIAATAQAANPEYGQCVGGQKKANFTESKCETVSVKIKKGKEEPAHKGTFEWKEAPLATCVAVKKGFYSNSECTSRDESKGKPKGKFEKVCSTSCADLTTKSGPVKFYNFTVENESEPQKLPQGATLTGLGGVISCTSSSGTGEFTGERSTTETVTFSGCSSDGEACTTLGQAAGTIEGALHTFLYLLPESKGVGMHLGSEEGFGFSCGSVSEDLEFGGVIGAVTGNIGAPSTASSDSWAVTNPSEGVEKERYYLRGSELEGGPFEHWSSVITNYAGSGHGEFIATGFEMNQEVTSQADQEVRP